MNFLSNVLVPALVTIGLGAGAWFFMNFVFGPWRDFLDLRKQIHVSLIFFANVLPNMPEGEPVHELWQSDFKHATREIRQHAAALKALNHSFWPWHHWLSRYRGYQIDEACRRLIGLSNSTGDAATIAEHGIEMALKLPTSLDDETVKQMIENRRRPTT